jgi:hypothetical protein
VFVLMVVFSEVQPMSASVCSVWRFAHGVVAAAAPY